MSAARTLPDGPLLTFYGDDFTGALSRKPERGHNGPDSGPVQAVAVAIRQACAASVLKVRSVQRETRWR